MSNQDDPPSPLIAPAVPLANVLSTPGPSANWLWDGFLARGKITLLTSIWKMGKTTLLSVLLAKMKAGGELAGRRVGPARPVVVSEEAPDYWGERGRRLDLAPDIPFFFQPFRSKPTVAEWQALLDSVEAMFHESQINLLVIDPLATFLPGRSENDAALMLEALLPLRTLTRRGMAVLLLHHPRKAVAEAGHAPRGSGALTGHADILLELRPYSRADDDRRRLCGASRFVETPRQVIIEWNEAGTDYDCLGETADEAFASNWDVVVTVLSAAGDRLPRREIWMRWPIVEVRPDESTLWRWLERAVAEGKILRAGTGRSNSPFQYWLKESEARWKRDPYYLPPLDPLYDNPDDKLPPLLPPSIRKLLEKRKKRRG